MWSEISDLRDVDKIAKGGKQMAKKKAAKKAKKAVEMLIVQSKVRDFLKNKGDFNIGSDLFEAVSIKVQGLLEDAARRAKENGRKTIQARDV